MVVETVTQKGKEKEEEESESEGMEQEVKIPDEIGVSLNLSKKNLKEFPRVLLDKLHSVQYLYLERNGIAELPSTFFQNTHSLKWLDLRNNNLIALPTIGLKSHPSLQVILLQGNRIRNLPVELATLPSLEGLQITGNPITNVPYDAIAEGFHGVIKHLQKLCFQDEILLPDSENVVVKPTATHRDSTDKRESTDEPTDSELRMWDLDKLSQWRKFMKKKSKKFEDPFQYCTKSETKNASQQPKISVSVRSQPRIPSRLQPFRCGVYSRNRHKITASDLYYMKLRRSRMGYKRKPITVAMIMEKAKKEAEKSQMRDSLEKQARKIQRMRDKEVLKSWRDHTKLTKQQIKLLDNYQRYPTKDFADKTPFDIDPEFVNMLNRADLYRSLKEYDSRSKVNRKAKRKVTALDLERQMNEIMAKLQQLDTNDEEESHSPRTKQVHVCNKMHKIMDIQKTLKNLQTLNSSVNGIALFSQPKIKN